ncbi:hypothetical protein HYH03_018389 [Edaphochlamys debaryana]|uniref:Peptidase S8/S53 domain-containing protein n=1 Tax=Edaphochlamys debaryana TaxID=47281 RepID=A0A836BPK1_9CHLO|nr:hypothetical protein HYH03_018389 [Edaphochlamys debaryana]|eukprot:KAG2482683.1 hypothetical protein HYH03_018389 [Edaphochlamys debaryana]
MLATSRHAAWGPAAATRLRLIVPLLAAFLGFAAANRSLKQASTVTYIISFISPSCNALSGAVAKVATGCRIDFCVAEANVATAQCPAGTALSASKFHASLGVDVVAQDVVRRLGASPTGVTTDATSNAATTITAATSSFYTGPIIGDPNDKWWPYQWAPRSIDATAAWAKGINGRCARVVMVDGAFGTLPPDLQNKFDMSVTRSFADISFDTDTGVVTHGIATSGVVGAEANNGVGIVGIAYGATLIGVQVFGTELQAADSVVVKGIVYAAQRKDKGGAGADIINLSLGEIVDRANRTATRSEMYGNGSSIMHIFNRAFAFANKNGVLVVAGAGNDAININAQKSGYSDPCQNANVICVAANAPVGICPAGRCAAGHRWNCTGGLDFANANYSRLASYSNYGTAVEVTAPGGDTVFEGDCWLDDTVLVSAPGGVEKIGFGTGTSFSAPHVSALAALYLQKAAMDKGALESELCNPGRTKTYVSPGQIKTAILRGAVLPPGNAGDVRKLFGAGIINVARTLGL